MNMFYNSSKKEINRLTVFSNSSISFAIKKIEKTDIKGLVVINKKNKFLGILSNKDIRKAIISKKKPTKVNQIYNKNSTFKSENTSQNVLNKILNKKKISFLPIVNNKRELVDIHLARSTKKNNIKKLDCPIVIMAGGQGKRLLPFTKVLPKPLIPVKNKTIIEHIIQSFLSRGAKNFYLTINYKSKILRSFFYELKPKYKVHFIEEKKPLGTAGAIFYLKKFINDNFILTNSDIITKINHSDLLKFHTKNKNDITLVATSKNYKIPYGTLHLDPQNQLIKINEKPSFNFSINTGLYCFSKKIFKYFKVCKKLEMNELISMSLKQNLKIGVFTISEKSWVDIGQWVEYKNTIGQIDRFIK